MGDLLYNSVNDFTYWKIVRSTAVVFVMAVFITPVTIDKQTVQKCTVITNKILMRGVCWNYAIHLGRKKFSRIFIRALRVAISLRVVQVPHLKHWKAEKKKKKSASLHNGTNRTWKCHGRERIMAYNCDVIDKFGSPSSIVSSELKNNAVAYKCIFSKKLCKFFVFFFFYLMCPTQPIVSIIQRSNRNR